jgi:hypothetical protein
MSVPGDPGFSGLWRRGRRAIYFSHEPFTRRRTCRRRPTSSGPRAPQGSGGCACASGARPRDVPERISSRYPRVAARRADGGIGRRVGEGDRVPCRSRGILLERGKRDSTSRPDGAERRTGGAVGIRIQGYDGRSLRRLDEAVWGRRGGHDAEEILARAERAKCLDSASPRRMLAL